jgi:hypothetical protein
MTVFTPERTRQEKERFSSRSGRRFPCGTRGFGIMTEYLGAGAMGAEGG